MTVEQVVCYVGDFPSVDRRFPELNLSFRFYRGVPRTLPSAQAALFEPNRNWIVGSYDAAALAQMAGRQHVVIRRAVALGDVIAAHGAAMAIKRREPNLLLSLQTSPMYRPIFAAETRYHQIMSTTDRVVTVPIDRIVNMDGLFELDHNPNNEKLSRVVKVWRHYYRDDHQVNAGLRPDFSVTLPEADRAWALQFLHRLQLDVETRRGKKLFACAVRSVQPQRALGAGLVREFCDRLVAEQGCEVLLIEPDAAQSWSAKGVHPAPNTSITQAMALLEHCDALGTMDSGAMWMGHTAALPMLVWLGPTPPDTKLNWHPLWPDGVRALQMNQWIDCPACYEHADACSFTFRCLRQPDRARFFAESLSAAKDLFNYVRPLPASAAAPR